MADPLCPMMMTLEDWQGITTAAMNGASMEIQSAERDHIKFDTVLTESRVFHAKIQWDAVTRLTEKVMNLTKATMAKPPEVRH